MYFETLLALTQLEWMQYKEAHRLHYALTETHAAAWKSDSTLENPIFLKLKLG